MAFGKRAKTAAIAAGLMAILTAVVDVTGSAPALAGPAATKAKGVDPSGQAMPCGNVGKWKMIYSDNFAKDVPLGKFPQAVADKWGAYEDGWPDTSHDGTYMPSKVVSIGKGVMDLNIHTENGVHMVAAPVPKINGANKSEDQLYGRYAVRFRADSLPEYKVAWLLWPKSDNWDEGEIDFPEADLNDKIFGYAHFKGDPTSQYEAVTGADMQTWHTAVTEWHPDYIRFELDGKEVGRFTDKSKIPSKPMHWVLQTETALNGHEPADATAGHVQIDWVAAYSLQR